ncbi:uncharacterized protein LOC142634829 [Castanea sativa]|uniref:uncharacterized protein LOC142634829 n=1 Tax=Castanea sativa TaxID=21020 RepID=UPI003F64D3EC
MRERRPHRRRQTVEAEYRQLRKVRPDEFQPAGVRPNDHCVTPADKTNTTINKNRPDEWRLTGFYGEPNTHKRHESWTKLRGLKSKNTSPWLCVRDFNEITLQSEKVGGRPRPHSQMQPFRDVLDDCNFIDLGYVGFPYTWHKHFADYTIFERLDRGLATADWFTMFPGTKIHHLDVTTSDHKPLWITPEGMDSNFHKPFRFEQMWLTDERCTDIIQAVWRERVADPWDTRILNKIDKCGRALTKWSKQCFGSVRRELENKNKLLQRAEKEVARTGNSARMKLLEREINQLLVKESMMWGQRSRIMWLRDGDRNTKFFHSKASQRRRRNYITKLRDDTGNWCVGQDHVNDTILNFYQTLFSSAEPSGLTDVVEVIPHVVTPDMNMKLESVFTIEEVEMAVEQMAPLKSPGLDGFMALKLDMSKAYDRVEWPFMEKVLMKMDFQNRWVKLMMACITTASYSVLINGEPHGHITPSRGLRQGDPLSPYLFLMCTEGLHGLISKAASNGDIRGVSICRNGPKLTHLLFADDSLIFCTATENECQTLLNILATYERASGQQINKAKTTLFFSKSTNDDMKNRIKDMLGVEVVHHYEKYLGLPSLVGRNKKRELHSY